MDRSATTTQLAELLSRTWMFSSFSTRERMDIAALATMRSFAARSTIVRKGEPGDGLFVLLEGRAKVSSLGSAGADTALAVMGPGEVFGEVALLDGCPRSATVTAIDRCETAFIDQHGFQELLVANPRIAVRLLGLLARRLRQLTERVEDRAFLQLEARLAKQLVQLADDYGGPLADGGVRIPMAISQQDLGNLVNATRESVNKQLRVWTKTGVLRHDRRKLDIFKLDDLRMFSNRS